MKIYVKDEDQILKEFCDDVKQCSGEQPTESDPTGCTGCDAQEEYMDKNVDRVVSESDKDRFVAVDEMLIWVECNLVKPFEGTLKTDNKEAQEIHDKVTTYNRGKFNELKQRLT